MRRFFVRCGSYTTGAVSVVIIGFVMVAAIRMAFVDPTARNHVASGVLNGVGVAIGTLAGGAIVMRFKSARKFVRRIVKEDENE